LLCKVKTLVNLIAGVFVYKKAYFILKTAGYNWSSIYSVLKANFSYLVFTPFHSAEILSLNMKGDCQVSEDGLDSWLSSSYQLQKVRSSIALFK